MHDQRVKLPNTEIQDTPKKDLSEDQRNDILGLRALLFNEIRSLSAKASKEQIEIARTKSELAQTIINSVKVEISYLQAKTASKSGFIPLPSPNDDKPE